MKIRSVVTLVGLAMSFALPTFPQQKDKVDPQIIEQLNANNKKYEEAVTNNDAAAVAALYAEDAIFVANTGPLYGRQAVEKFYADLFKAWHPKSHIAKRDPNSPRIVGMADNIASNGDWSETGQGQNGEPVQVKGYWSEIQTREGDAWKIWMLTWNITPPPAAATTQQKNTPDPQLREQLLALAKKFEDAWNNNDATALAALFTEDAVLIEESGPVYGQEAIEKHYADVFENVHFSDNHTMYNDPNSNSPHAIGTDGNEMWENGEWSMTWQVKGGNPEQHKGYHASIAVREGGVWKKRMVMTNITPSPTK